MGKTKRRGIRRSAQEWRKILARSERSGQSQREFCEGEGLALSTFQWWRRKLSALGAEREHRDGAGFVELAEDGADREEFEAESLGWDVELELGGGMVLRLRRASTC